MYQIINTTQGQLLGYASEVLFIRNKEGVYIPASEENATGIAFQSVAYNLERTDGVGAEESAIAVEIDAEAALNDLQDRNNMLESQLVYTAMMTDTLVEEEQEEDEGDV